MDLQKSPSPKAIPEQKLDYLGLQAAVGITKHDGGAKATNELVELCKIGRDKRALSLQAHNGQPHIRAGIVTD